jgi:malate dehydrogenase
MLMALDERVSELSLFDLTVAAVPVAGVAADLGHIETPCKVKGYSMAPDQKAIDVLKECLTGCHVVLIPAGVPRKPGMTRDDLFATNAGIAKGLVEACAAYCPQAILGMIVNPVNSVVPAMCELYKKSGLDHKRICGVTTLDIVRANKFVAELTSTLPSKVSIPVVGGHAGATIVPLFSQDAAASSIDAAKISDLDKRVQDAGTEVVNAKGGKGSATLSMAYAGARFGKAVLSGLSGTPTKECAYVASDVSSLPYFSTVVTFGKSGVEHVAGVGALNAHEKKRVDEASTQLKGEIQSGLDYASKNTLSKL